MRSTSAVTDPVLCRRNVCGPGFGSAQPVPHAERDTAISGSPATALSGQNATTAPAAAATTTPATIQRVCTDPGTHTLPSLDRTIVDHGLCEPNGRKTASDGAGRREFTGTSAGRPRKGEDSDFSLWGFCLVRLVCRGHGSG